MKFNEFYLRMNPQEQQSYILVRERVDDLENQLSLLDKRHPLFEKFSAELNDLIEKSKSYMNLLETKYEFVK